jgi:VAD1 Analog of StAR-related lipid transfer domain
MQRAMTAPVGELQYQEERSPELFFDPPSATTSQSDSISNQDAEKSPSMRAFLKQFWSKNPASERPEILGVFRCAYKPKDKPSFLSTYLHGCLYTTKTTMYFLSWDNKNFVLNFSRIVSVQKEKGFIVASNDNAIAVTYMNAGVEEAFTLGKLQSRDKVLSHLQNLHEESKGMTIAVNSSDRNLKPSSNSIVLAPVPHDRLLESMDLLVSKTIKNSTVKTVFETVWADKGASFYGQWLKEEECFDIDVPPWTFSNEGDEIANDWCKEKYDQKRLVAFKFHRTTHLYIGPPVASVKQNQYCRVEGGDRVVVAISAAIDGIPYADTFEVEVRWVARRIGDDVKVDVGSCVVFKKSTMLKSQIKAGTVTETQKVHQRFFEAVRKACTGPSEAESGEGLEEYETEDEPAIERKEAQESQLFSIFRKILDSIPYDNTTLVILVIAFVLLIWVKQLWSSIFGRQVDVGRLESRIDELQADVRALKQSLEIVIRLLEEPDR